METHAHHLHKAPGKRIWHYFFEFLMLFLAVFAGFLAENFRERQVDIKREREYMQSMVEDLKSDTATFKSYARNNVEIFATIDSLIRNMKSADRQKKLSMIYFQARNLTLKLLLHYSSTRTYDQMKNSGQLRIIREKWVAEGIGSYYNSLQIMNSFNDVLLAHDYNYMRTMGKLFDAQVLFDILKERKDPSPPSLSLLTEDPVVINELLTAAQYIYGALQLSQNVTNGKERDAESLISLIQAKYDLGK